MIKSAKIVFPIFEIRENKLPQKGPLRQKREYKYPRKKLIYSILDIGIFHNTYTVTIAKKWKMGLKFAKNWVYIKNLYLFGQASHDH